MKTLGNYNLFTSHFVMGTSISNYDKLDIIQSLNKWLDFKDSDFGMDRFRVNRTQYVCFLHEIDLETFSNYLNSLIIIYKKHFPYSEKKDFIEQNFGYTLYFLNDFILKEFTFIGSPPENNNYDFYYYYHDIDRQVLDFAILSDKTIEYYKQYFKKVIQSIIDVDYIDEKKDEDLQSRVYKGSELALIFYFVNNYKVEVMEGLEKMFKKKNLEEFLKNHNAGNSYDYIRQKYYSIDKEISKGTFSIQKIKNITPFIEENYKDILDYVQKEINFLDEQQSYY